MSGIYVQNKLCLIAPTQNGTDCLFFMLDCCVTSNCSYLVREQLKELTKQYDKSEDDLKALQSVGQVRDWL